MALELETSDYFRDFDWGNLKAFYYVAKVGNISNAAHFLKLAQSSMSRQITGLEKHLGYPLFTRNRGGVKLTRKGEELLAIVESTFLGLKGFIHNNHAINGGDGKRKIRIATSHAVAVYIINDLLLKYNKEHPNLIFELIEDDYILDIIMSDVDIAIRPYDFKAQCVIQEPIFILEKKLYASHEYIKKYGEPKSADDLKNHKIIAPSNPEEYPYAELNWILKVGMNDGSRHEPVFTSTSIECLIDAAKSGIGIVGGYEAMSILKHSNLKNILPTLSEKKEKIYLTYPDYLKGDHEIISLKNYLQNILLFNDVVNLSEPN